MNANAKMILVAVAGGALNAKAIAEATELKVAQVTGNFASLKKEGLIEVVEGQVKLTKEGKKIAKKETVTSTDNPNSTKEKRVTRADQCRAIFGQNPEAPRAELMKRFQEEVGLSKKGSNTYIHNLRTEHKKKQAVAA